MRNRSFLRLAKETRFEFMRMLGYMLAVVNFPSALALTYFIIVDDPNNPCETCHCEERGSAALMLLPEGLADVLLCLSFHLAWVLPLVASVRCSYVTPTRRVIDQSFFGIGLVCMIYWSATLWMNYSRTEAIGFGVLLAIFPMVGCVYADTIFLLRSRLHWREFVHRHGNR